MTRWTFEEIKQLLEIVREHELSEFELERDGLQDSHPPAIWSAGCHPGRPRRTGRPGVGPGHRRRGRSRPGVPQPPTALRQPPTPDDDDSEWNLRS